MAKRLDPLAESKINREGEPTDDRNPQQVVVGIVDNAKREFPEGLPEGSVFAQMSMDTMLQEANRIGLTLAPLIKEKDLRLVLEHRRQTTVSAPVGGIPAGIAIERAPDPVPMLGAQPKPKITPAASPTGKWVVSNEPKKACSFGGQIFHVKKGAIIELRHYGEDGISAIRNQGVELQPIEE